MAVPITYMPIYNIHHLIWLEINLYSMKNSIFFGSFLCENSLLC